ncbi:MAG TPA: hypothetical protein PKA41_16550, partial [Verrucomicrobiota bacterium]|nr:hypothetical protein [Verrucomicrobiota bacterium]
MSAASQSPTLRFFGSLKNLFTKAPAAPAAERKSVVAPVKTAPVRPVAARTGANGTEHISKAHAASSAKSNGQVIVLPLQNVIMAMTTDLRGKVRSAVSDDLTISVPVDKVLPQLGKGAVKIPFGEVRRAAPHVFAVGIDHDHLPVVLPLAEVVSQLNPTLLPRRNDQKQQASISEDIVSPFSNLNGQNVVVATPTPPAASQTPAVSTPIPKRAAPFDTTPVFRTVKPLPASSNTKRFARVPASSIPAPMPPSTTTPAAPVVPEATPVVPARPAKPSAAFAFAPITPIAPDETEAADSKPIPMPTVTPKLPEASVRSKPVLEPAAPITPLSPAPAPVVPGGPPLTVAVAALVQEWPETLRQEIVKLNLASGQLALPAHLIEAGLKRGKVAFPWKQLRVWMTPMSTSPSVHDDIEVMLPLKVIAPLFLSRNKSAGAPQNVVAVDETIPNLFFGFPQPEPAAPVTPPAPAVLTPAATAKPVDTNYYVFDDNSDTAFVDQTAVKRPMSQAGSGTDFLVKYSTPNEIVSRAAALDGVAGVGHYYVGGIPEQDMKTRVVDAEQVAGH